MRTIDEICPEMHANEICELYDRHLKVSPILKSHYNTHNSVKHEVVKMTKRPVLDEVPKFRARCISGYKCNRHAVHKSTFTYKTLP